MGITVRELVTKLTVDGDKATDKLAKFGLAVNGITAGLNILVGVFDVVKDATVGFVADIAAQADALDKQAAATGKSTQQLQRMSFIAEQTGVPMVNLIKGTQNLARNMRDAALAGEGKGSFNEALAEIGLTTKDLIGLSFPEQVGKIGDAMKSLASAEQRVAVSQKLIGEEAGPKMASLLAQGSEGVNKLTETFESLGGATSDAAIKAGVDLTDALSRVRTFVNLLRLEVLEFLPEITETVDRFTEWLKINRTMLRSRLVAFFKRVISAFKSLADSGTDWIKIFGDIVDLTVKLVKFLLDLIEAMGGLEKAVVASVAVLASLQFTLLALANPLGALLVGLTAAAGGFALFTNEALKAQRAQEDFGQELQGAIELSKPRVKALAKAVQESVFFGKKLNPEVLSTLAISDRKSFDEVFKAVGGSITVSDVGSGFDASKSQLRKRAAEIRKKAIEVRELGKVDREAEERRRRGVERFRANQDRIDRENALQAQFKQLRGIRTGTESKEEDEPDVTDAELLALINQAAQTGQSITGLIGKRGVPGGVPPVIAMTNNIVNQNNEVTIEVGGEGADGEQIREDVIDELRRERQDELRQAINALQPVRAI